MKACALSLLLLFSLSAGAQFKHEDFEKLYNLRGTWQMQAKKGFLYERWEKGGQDLMLSKSYKVNGKDTLALESVRLTFVKGEIFYTPTVPDQNEGKPIPFKLSKIEGNSFYFENKGHDFPQRIIYNLKGEFELECMTDGETANGYAKQDFLFKRLP